MGRYWVAVSDTREMGRLMDVVWFGWAIAMRWDLRVHIVVSAKGLKENRATTQL